MAAEFLIVRVDEAGRPVEIIGVNEGNQASEPEKALRQSWPGHECDYAVVRWDNRKTFTVANAPKVTEKT